MRARHLLVPTLLFFVACSVEAQEPSSQRKAKAERSSVPSEINKRFLDKDFDAEAQMKRWEIESREIYACRKQVVKSLGLAPGKAIADVGSGTGLFVSPFSEAVGEKGKVYAVDIAPRFIDLIRKRVKSDEMANVEVVLSNQKSTKLPANSVDVVFACDTYHHFEYHVAMLQSIRTALRPGGQFAIIDFERIPGKTSDFLLGHVRAGKEVFQKEIEEAGFRLIEEVKIAGFEQNYFLRFEKK